MGLKGLSAASIDDLVVKIEQKGKTAVREGVIAMEREGEKIRDLAREYAPFDEGKLEAAIKSRTIDRDALGRFQRKVVSVYVDENMPGSGGARTVGQYALYIHEMLEPYGDLKLGKESEAKDRHRGIVGGGYMARAFADRKSFALRQITIAVKRALR